MSVSTIRTLDTAEIDAVTGGNKYSLDLSIPDFNFEPILEFLDTEFSINFNFSDISLDFNF
uniref:hypothetical protein n=1 Tax=Halomonas sp. TaxID=1486246 RepID=UPI0026068B48|nr:hypothetical protein [Halomonas sp.]